MEGAPFLAYGPSGLYRHHTALVIRILMFLETWWVETC